METTIKVQKEIPEHIREMIKGKIEEKKEFARKVRAGEYDYLKNNVIRTI